MTNARLVLASSSPYRLALLKTLKVDFIADSPEVNEAPLSAEMPAQLATRLGIAKAHALQHRYPQHLIIGSDQVAALHNQFLSKPGDRDTAIRQLQLASGHCVEFFTSVCVLNTNTGDYLTDMDTTRVYFKALTLTQIERYIDLDTPFDCAGSFKAESLGIALFEKIVSEDHNALIGLPLIKLCALLEKLQFNIL
ncbi:MAG: septum formation inhibitor Maf [Methylococcaceae bacterium]|nr:septum formation inhibitor Maf [Methylococcaceae bacterium]